MNELKIAWENYLNNSDGAALRAHQAIRLYHGWCANTAA